MPVYVTRAHVTIGDAGKRHANNRFPSHRRAFHISDICKTPYCFRSFLVVFIGLAVVAGGAVMTIIGYRPTILIPWYHYGNITHKPQNYSDPTSVPRILGEPGPLRILVYIGPILMGIGFFSMMMAIVLFCEIKDRYFNNILPKRRRDAANRKKENLYATIIDEFRKNYFRGIEVPLKKHSERRKSKQRFSISLSGSGSLISFGRRLSHEFQRRRRRSSRESQTDRATISRKRSTIRKFLDPDSWLKTSSLPNIRHKDSFVELHNIYNIDTKIGPSSKRESKSCGPHLDIFRISGDTSGVVNPAYRESPPDKRRRPALRKQRRVDATENNTHVTTVLVHRESTNNNEENMCTQNPPSTLAGHGNNKAVQDQPVEVISDVCRDEIIDIDIDINMTEKCNETDVDIPDLVDHRINGDVVKENNVCTCGQDIFCTLHALGMDSGGSSLSLSWDNVPCVYNDARRNTEPNLIYSASQHSCEDSSVNNSVLASQHSTSQVAHREVIKSKSTAFSRDSDSSEDSPKLERTKKPKGPFRTKINVFKSDSNLFRGRRYSIFEGQMYYGLSTDSLDLTDEMLKSFEMAETAYI